MFMGLPMEWVVISRGLPNPGIEPMSLVSSAMIGGFFTTASHGKAIFFFL